MMTTMVQVGDGGTAGYNDDGGGDDDDDYDYDIVHDSDGL